jgi:hypothetical protein
MRNRIISVSGPPGDGIDLDEGAKDQRGDTHRGACWQPIFGEEAPVGGVEGGIVTVEMRQETAALQDVVKAKAQLAQNEVQIFHHPHGLRFDAIGQGRRPALPDRSASGR